MFQDESSKLMSVTLVCDEVSAACEQMASRLADWGFSVIPLSLSGWLRSKTDSSYQIATVILLDATSQANVLPRLERARIPPQCLFILSRSSAHKQLERYRAAGLNCVSSQSADASIKERVFLVWQLYWQQVVSIEGCSRALGPGDSTIIGMSRVFIHCLETTK